MHTLDLEKREVRKHHVFAYMHMVFSGFLIRQGKVEVAAEQADNLRYEEERQWIRRQW